MSDNGTMRSRRPQLNDTITKLDQMVDGLAIAIPGAVADSIREALGPASTAVIKDAVKVALAEVLKERASEEAKPTPVPPPAPAPTPPTPPKPSRWAKVKTALVELKNWAVKRLAPVVTKAALGWTVVKVVGGATMHSRAAILTTALSSVVAGIVGFTLGPIGAAVLLGLATGMIAATAVWATPVARFLVAFQED